MVETEWVVPEAECCLVVMDAGTQMTNPCPLAVEAAVALPGGVERPTAPDLVRVAQPTVFQESTAVSAGITSGVPTDMTAGVTADVTAAVLSADLSRNEERDEKEEDDRGNCTG